MILCLDVGNTHLHWGVLKSGMVFESGDFPSADMEAGLGEISRKWSGQLQGASWCSVVPTLNARLQAQLQTFLPAKLIVGLDYRKNLGIPIHYPHPEEIGQDRLANSLAASQLYGAPVIVIDMGTATTFDIVSTEGGYEGGIIAPGMGVMTRYLHEQTALLPTLSDEDLVSGPVIGKSTRQAMRTGCVIGFTGMIQALLESVRKALYELGETHTANVILTGGSSGSLFSKQLPQYVWNPYLTLQGLELYFFQSLQPPASAADSNAS